MKKGLLAGAIAIVAVLSLIAFSLDSAPYTRTILSTVIFLTPAVYMVAQNSEAKAETKERHAKDYKVYSKVFSPIFMLLLIIVFYDLWTGQLNLLVSSLGVVFLFFGLGVYVKSVLTLGKFFSRDLEIKQGHKLITSGIYTQVRHPSYLGSFFLFLGFGVIANSVIALLILILIVVPWLCWRIKNEEKLLEKAFGKEFLDYKKRTKLLLPKIL